MLKRSVSLMFFLMLRSIFQYGRPRMGPRPASRLSIPRIGGRNWLNTATGSLNMLSSVLGVDPATDVPTLCPNWSTPPGTLLSTELPAVYLPLYRHCSFVQKLFPSAEPNHCASVSVLQYSGAPLPAVKIGAMVHPPRIRPRAPCCPL